MRSVDPSLPRFFLCALAFVGASSSAALADEVHLKNGRKLEGSVLKQTSRSVVLATPGGRLEVPRSMVKKIVDTENPKVVFLRKRKAVDPTDSKALLELADWAARNKLGQEAKDVRAQANGLILEERVNRAKALGSAAAFIRVFHWARRAGLARTTQIYLLSQAHARDASHPELKTAHKQLQRSIDDEKAAIAREAALAKAAHYKNPESERLKSGGTSYPQRIAIRAHHAKKQATRTRAERSADLQKLEVSLSKIAPKRTAQDEVEAARGRSATYKD